MEHKVDNKWLDEALTNAIGSGEKEPDFEKWKQQHPEAVEILTSRASQGSSTPARPLNTGRTIMKSPIIKLAAAAVIVVAVTLSVSLWDKSVTSAYALGQTIEAMRSIRSIHAYCTDWDGCQGEVWVQIDPETGSEEYCRGDIGNLLIVGTPEVTYYYYKDKNLVRIHNGYVPASQVRFSRLFEDLFIWLKQYDGKLSISSKYDEDLKREVIILHVTVPSQADFGEMEFIVVVDIETRLPLNVRKLKGEHNKGVRSVDRVEYNMTIPEGMFEFQIPEGSKVIYENKDKKG